MSYEVLTGIIEKTTNDETFRTQLLNETEKTLRKNNWELTDKEKEAILKLKVDTMDQGDRTLKERVSKALYGTETHSILW